jgi:hypothetical protein
MALRTMLPSTAKVGDTIHFAFPHKPSSETSISAFEVTLNGRKIDNPETVITSGTRGTSWIGGQAANFVFSVKEPGIYQFEIRPIIGGEKGQPRLNTVEVTE